MDVRTLCLGLLTLGDATGYEIRKMFTEGAIGEVFDANFGSIYPALSRLTEDGLVVATAQAQEGRPDKKVYSITEAGRAVFTRELSKPPPPDRFRSDFFVTLVFAHLLTPGHVARLLDDRLAHHEAEIARLRAIDCGTDADPMNGPFMVGFGIAHHQAAIDYITGNRHLLEQDPHRIVAGTPSPANRRPVAPLADVAE